MSRAPKLTVVPSAPEGRAPRRAAVNDRQKVTPKSEQTRHVILEAAVDCVDRYGFHGTNLSRVAEVAGVTRGCLQYYFRTTEDIAAALIWHVSRRHWEIYETRALSPPPGRSLIEHAIDTICDEEENRYRVVRLELLAAARTARVLQPVFRDVAEEWERRAKSFTTLIFGNAALADTPQFRAARDLTELVSDYLALQVFPGDREQRITAVREALRISLHMLWRLPSLDREPELIKPRVRIPAGRKADTSEK